MKRIITFTFILVALLMISTTAFAVELTTPSATNLPEELPTELPAENPSELPTVEPDELDFLRESLNDLFILSLPSGTNAPIAITGSAEYSAPNAFSAQYSCGMESEIKILDIKFEFEDSKDTQCTIKYEIVTEAGDTLSVRRNYTLYYDKEAFLSGAKTIINGIYVEIITGPESFATVFGKVEGQLMMFESDDYAPGIAGKNLIMLTHLAEKSQGLVDGFITNLIFFLDTLDAFIPLVAEPTTTPAPSPTGTPVPTPSPSATPALPIVDDISTDIGNELPIDDSGMPQPFDPLQVSVGAILVAAFISLTNASSSTVAGAGMSAFNITSPATTPELDIPVEVKVDPPGGLPKEAAKERFKDAFQTRPESTSETMEVVADISTDSSMQETFSEVASATSQADEKLASATAKSSPSFGKIIVNTFAFIADFIKQLLTNLRDMLTDEARSHTSGKIAETLDDGGDAVEQIADGGE